MSTRKASFLFVSGAIALLAGCGSSGSNGSDRLASFALKGDGGGVAGAAFSLEVDAISGAGDTFQAYAGTITFESDDPQAVLPAPYPYVAGDQGVHKFSLTFKTSGPHTVRVSDSAAQGSRIVTVAAGAPTNEAVVSGNGQGGPAGLPLGQKLVVKISDDFGNGVPNTLVDWQAVAGGGSVASDTTSSDASGLASVIATLGALGSNQFSAASAGKVVTFDATGMHGDVHTLVKIGGDGQSAAAGRPLPAPFVLKATDDMGSPYPGVTISWTVSAGSGSFPSPTATTGPDGLASITPTLAQTAGDNRFKATGPALIGNAPPLPTLEFQATGVPGPAAKIAASGGNTQIGIGGASLAQPFVVHVTDVFDNAVAGQAIAWSVTTGGGAITPPSIASDTSGNASAKGTLGASDFANTYTAAASGLDGSPITFTAQRNPYKLVYTDPASNTAKLRLVRNSASTDSAIVLDLVVGGAALTGYSAGLNLPVDATRVLLDAATPIAIPSAPVLNPGGAPSAIMAAMPGSGPLAGQLVSGLSQKADGAGAVTTDTALPAGTVLYSIKLNLVPSGTQGVVFDGTAPGFVLPSGGLLSKIGNPVAGKADIAIGKLVVGP